ncbi:MAG TPA: recombinase, partial [Casimicrobium sp.]|nr:recombinase [Casimicrobium sp.]
MPQNILTRWRAARDASHQLDSLLAQADPNAPLGARNEWLMEVGYWLRRPSPSTAGANADANAPTTYSEHARLRLLLQVLDRNAAQGERVGAV